MSSQEIVAPVSEIEIAGAVREAAEKNTTFEIVSGGTKRGFGRPVAADCILDVRAISGIVKYEPEELVLTARAGTPMTEVEAALAEKNQMLGFEPADWGPLFGSVPDRATLAGIVGTNACGARRAKAGAVRDHVIGCRFVNGVGETIKAGGPVIKNVTGFDVSRLMCGAFGTLGVLTELTLRATPKPVRVAALTVACGAEDGLRVMREAAQMPLDPTGLVYLPTGTGEGMAAVRVEGAEEPVEQKLAELEKRFRDRDTSRKEGDDTAAIFRDAREGRPFLAMETDIWRLCVPPSSAYEALTAAGDPDFWYADWAGGLLWLGLPGDEGTAQRLRAIAARLGGHATLMRASAEARAKLDVFEPEGKVRAGLTRSVKEAFDPRRLFNPGRMYKDI